MLGTKQGKLLATEMDFWQMTGRESRLDKVRHSRFNKIMDVKKKKNIIEVIEQRILKWIGGIDSKRNRRQGHKEKQELKEI